VTAGQLRVRAPRALILTDSAALRRLASDCLIRNGWICSEGSDQQLALVACDSCSVEQAERVAARYAHRVLLETETAHDVLRRAIRNCDPRPLTLPVLRLAATFGAQPICAQLGGFRAQLEEALAEPDEARLHERAHRLAGLAGTLGFAAAGAALLALSEGVHGALEPARREARRAILAIDSLVPEHQIRSVPQ
jgi:hypothetical protein